MPTTTPDPKIVASTRILRLPQVIARVGLSRASIYQYMNIGAFPKPIAIGFRARGWLERDIDSWIEKRINAQPGDRL